MHTTTNAERRADQFARYAQFNRYLCLMRDRAHNEARRSCFVIFEEHSPDTRGKGRHGNEIWNRFVQFSFEADRFCLDLPRDTLRPAEAQQILRERPGFFYLRDRPQFTLRGEDVKGHDPFRKMYRYGDEPDAAQDTAYLFFTLWRLPIDARLYVSAAPFAGPKQWEYGTPIGGK
jgi:hypothetical protein